MAIFAIEAQPYPCAIAELDEARALNMHDEGLDWVLVEPNGAEADFRSALFGFDHGNLKRMILEDKLDQTATIMFQTIERNGPVASSEVSFRPPAGADVIGKPRK